MTKNQYDSKLAKIRKRNESRERRRKLREERRKYWPKFIMPSTSKIVLIISALLCIEILIFCQYMIIKNNDSNALYSMVGVLISFMPVVLGYFLKSTKENTKDGIVFETAILERQKLFEQQNVIDNVLSEDAVG